MSLGPLHIIKQSNAISSASVIFLHGSGDTGEGVLNWIKFLIGEFALPHVKFLFPTAPVRPYTPLGGEMSNVWFDRYNVTPDVPEHLETLNSIGGEVTKLIKQITASGIPMNRIIIGGFSMGGALAFHTAFRYSPGLAGCFTLSSFLNKDSIVYKEIQNANTTPLYMCHGERDSMVPISWGETTFKNLTKLGVKGEFTPIKNTLHELKKEEILGLFEWIKTTVPPLDSDK